MNYEQARLNKYVSKLVLKKKEAVMIYIVHNVLSLRAV